MGLLAEINWNRLASLVQLCEEEGRWPELLRIAHVMLLSKGGMPVDKLQARPITVLPLIYRAWAKIRAKQLRTWTRSCWSGTGKRPNSRQWCWPPF